jgi:hypothetical protein
MLNSPNETNAKAEGAVTHLSKPLVIALIANLCALLLFSYWLAGHRLYQVDECQNMFVARLLATGKAEASYTGVTLFVAPLAWVAGRATNSSEMFAQGRLIGLAIFWLNVFLLTLATQKRLFSAQGLIALQGAATLAPLWDYGFEIRHDNLMLTGLLLMWCAIRIVPSRPGGYFVVGAVAVALQFVAFKAFVYCLPVFAIGLAAIARFPRRVVLKLVLASIAGGIAAFLIVRLAYGVAGWWDLYIRDLRGISDAAPGGYVFGPLRTLRRLVVQTPLVTALGTLGMISSVAQAWRFRRINISPEGLLPEALLLFVALTALFANPAPFPYNLVNLAPYAFLLAFRYGTTLVQNSAHRVVTPVVVGAVVIGHLLPFGIATYRHVGMTNDRQKTLMQVAEALTEPGRDPVYDGVGMVPTRDSIHGQWLLHTLNVRNFIDGPAPHIREMLERKPAAVIIPSYRTDWLPSEDHGFIRDRYLPLADDFWVLGTILPAGGSAFQIFHSGRYRVYAVGSSSTEFVSELDSRSSVLFQDSTRLEGTLDGRPLVEGSVELPIGTHVIECPPQYIYAIVWLGPRLNGVPQLAVSDHRTLFVNWY